MRWLGIVTATLAVLAVSVSLNGAGLVVLWGWFIVPTFGLPSLSLGAAVGLALVVEYLTARNRDRKDEEWGDVLARGLGWAIAKPAFFLFIGWAVKVLS